MKEIQIMSMRIETKYDKKDEIKLSNISRIIIFLNLILFFILK